MIWISIIICSRTKILKPSFLENIKKTIGCDYELIVIDNSQNQYSIFEAYNLGIEKSKTAYLCFLHDDIFFHTTGWGTILINIFKSNKQVGLIGIAGAKVKSNMPSPWWNCKENQQVINIVQHNNKGKKETTTIGFDSQPEQDVVVIDGVFMVLRKNTGIYFNSNMIGFHNYDLNLSFECAKRGHKAVVTKQILIEHFSQGALNKEWVESTYKLHNVYQSILPLKANGENATKDLEIRNAVNFMESCIEFKCHKILKMVWWQLFLLYPNPIYHVKLWKRLKNKKSC
ncbi:glycosyltransferase [Mariniflexile sp.]|uniref:glycosyltransferase n=1 Tax=Mariniflexile sp. TaxID=1979402 RepID=UPI00404836FF